MNSIEKYVRFRILALWIFAAMQSLAGALWGIELPAEAERREIAPGAWSFSWTAESAEGPLAFSGFYWEIESEELRMVSSAGRGKLRGNEVPSKQALRAREEGWRPVAAANADFFEMRGPAAGAVTGLFVRGRELLSLADRPAVAVFEDGRIGIDDFGGELWLETEGGQTVRIDRLNPRSFTGALSLYTGHWGGKPPKASNTERVRLRAEGPLISGATVAAEVVSSGDERGARDDAENDFFLLAHGKAREKLPRLEAGERVRIRSTITPDPRLLEAVGGFPFLLRDGEVIRFPGADPADFIPGPGDPNARHPRTTIGKSDRHAVVLVVDGRRPDHSVGLTLPELGEVFRDLGCDVALNLDGGGSSAVWADGGILNRPSGGRERPVANTLILLRRE